MQLLDQHLKDLVTEGAVTIDEAARFAVDPQAIFALAHPKTVLKVSPVTAEV